MRRVWVNILSCIIFLYYICDVDFFLNEYLINPHYLMSKSLLFYARIQQNIDSNYEYYYYFCVINRRNTIPGVYTRIYMYFLCVHNNPSPLIKSYFHFLTAVKIYFLLLFINKLFSSNSIPRDVLRLCSLRSVFQQHDFIYQVNNYAFSNIY